MKRTLVQDIYATMDYFPEVIKELLLNSRKMGLQELNKHICALSQEEREIMFNLAEVEDNDKGPSKKDFSWGEWQGVLLSLPHLVFIMLF